MSLLKNTKFYLKMKFEKQIELILGDTNFKMISGVMEILDWKYNNSKTSPSITHLEALAKKCLVKASEDGSYSQGGFEAECINDILELRFILERVNTLSYLVGDKSVVNEESRKAKK